MQDPEFYVGRCPVGGEIVSPRERIEFPADVTPNIACPVHRCLVYLGVVPEEEHERLWAKMAGTK